MQSAPEWYQAGQDNLYDHNPFGRICLYFYTLNPYRHLAQAHDAFKKAVDIFDGSITKDPAKQSLAKGSTSIHELEQAVKNSKAKYEGKNKEHKARKWLTRISSRVRYYGNIGDVLVQQYPEYVSLAWGAFKLLFIVSRRNMTCLVHAE